MRYEFQIPEGIEVLAKAELAAHKDLGGQALRFEQPARGCLSLVLDKPLKLTSVPALSSALYTVLTFPGKRPSVILGQENFSKSLQELKRIVSGGKFRGIRLAAAGSDSSLMQRIAQQLAVESGLNLDQQEGEFLVRIRPSLYQENSWDLLLRHTPRPFSRRNWRVSDLRGALNACIACAMLQLVSPDSASRCLHLMCGSGTLLIEHALRYPFASICGIDISSEHLALCTENIRAARLALSPAIFEMDACALDFNDQSFDILTCNFPWGEHLGKRSENKELYMRSCQEAWRVLSKKGRFIALSQDQRNFEEACKESGFLIKEKYKVAQRGFHPTIYLLVKE